MTGPPWQSPERSGLAGLSASGGKGLEAAGGSLPFMSSLGKGQISNVPRTVPIASSLREAANEGEARFLARGFKQQAAVKVWGLEEASSDKSGVSR